MFLSQVTVYFKLNATFDFDHSAQELIKKVGQITQVFLNFTVAKCFSGNAFIC